MQTRSLLLAALLTAPALAHPLSDSAASLNLTYQSEVDLNKNDASLSWWELDLDAYLCEPQQIATDVYFIPAVHYQATYLDHDDDFLNNAGVSFGDLDHDFHTFTALLNFAWKPKTSPWSIGVQLAPELSTDFGHVDEDDLFLGGTVVAGYRFNKDLYVGLGAGYARVFGDENWGPVPAFVWTPADNVRFELQGPNFQASWMASDNWIFRFRSAPGGGVWNIDHLGESTDLGIVNYQVGVIAEYQIAPNWWLAGGVGASLAGKVEQRETGAGDRIFKSGLDDGAYSTLGVKVATW